MDGFSELEMPYNNKRTTLTVKKAFSALVKWTLSFGQSLRILRGDVKVWEAEARSEREALRVYASIQRRGVKLKY